MTPYDGTGFERVWKDSVPQLWATTKSHWTRCIRLRWQIRHGCFTGWTERFDDYCDYCIQTLYYSNEWMRKPRFEFLHVITGICGVTFTSCHNVTRSPVAYLVTHIGRHLPMPTLKNGIMRACIPPPKPGRYEGVACVDYKGLYPSIILSHNLSWKPK